MGMPYNALKPHPAVTLWRFLRAIDEMEPELVRMIKQFVRALPSPRWKPFIEFDRMGQANGILCIVSVKGFYPRGSKWFSPKDRDGCGCGEYGPRCRAHGVGTAVRMVVASRAAPAYMVVAQSAVAVEAARRPAAAVARWRAADDNTEWRRGWRRRTGVY